MKSLNLDFTLNYHAFNLSLKTTLPLNGIIGVFGHSGSGKSTLLRAIAGLEKNIQGNISLSYPSDNADKKSSSTILSNNKLTIKPENRHIGLVFQDARLFPHLTVRENLEFAAKRCKKRSLILDDILELTELTSLEHMNVTQLSGGQKQRVALARAILGEPELLLLDEPLSALDQQAKSKLLSLISKINQQLNLPILYVSHSLEELQFVCDDLLVLSNGRALAYGNIHTVIHRLNKNESPVSAVTEKALLQPLTHQQTSLSLPIKTQNNGQGLMVLSLNNKQEVLLPAPSNMHKKIVEQNILPAHLRCFILASDIGISLSQPLDSSIVNHLSGTITKIEPQHYRVLISVECEGQVFFANISAYSQQRLSLTLQQNIYLQFKASAVRTFLY